MDQSGQEYNTAELEQLYKFYKNYQLNRHAPTRFKFIIREGEDSEFNYTIIVDIFYKDRRLILYIIDEATGYSAAYFLLNESSKTVWIYFRRG